MDKLAGRKTLKVGNILDEFEKDKVKAGVDLVALFASFGVDLTAKGKNHMGRCPWHEDGTPSLSVDREKGLYNCFGCGESGDAFSLVEKMRGTDFKGALEFLKGGRFEPVRVPTPPLKPEVLQEPQVPAPVEKKPEPEDVTSEPLASSLTEVAQWYQRELHSNKQAQDYLESRGLLHWESLGRMGFGYCHGNLGQALSDDQRRELTDRGILREDGREALEGCVVVPLTDPGGQVVGFYGRKIGGEAAVKHLYLKGGHRGLMNAPALAIWREEIIVTESVLDAVSLLVLGIERVVPCYGTNGFTAVHLQALKAACVKKVVIAFDADDGGRRGAEKLAKTLLAEGFAVAKIEPQAAKDWNQALITGCTRESVEALILAAPVSLGHLISRWQYQEHNQRWVLEKDGLVYKAMGSTKRIGAALRLSVRIERGDKRYLDHVDLYSARSRGAFKEQAATTLGMEAAIIEQDLLALLDQLEAEAESQGQEEMGPVTLSPEEEALGLSLLKSPTLLSDIVADMAALGHVGEEVNKLLVYLAASSRKLSDPVSIVIVSQSAAGKSYLIDTVRALMPSEEVVNLTSLSDQALNYMSDGELMNKLLVMGEAVHNQVVEHQIREMLSAKELSRMVVTKDERTGKLTSALVRQKAVVSLMMSTTSHEMNGENASRCFFVHADESEAQTKRIHEAQNQKYSLEAIRRRQEVIPAIIKKHHAAQRLLKPVNIVNPFAGKLEFPSSLMRSRRDNKQLGELVAAVCFLRQYQKRRQCRDGLEYIECDQSDIETAWGLFREGIMKATYLELPDSLVRLYDEVRQLCRGLASDTGLKIEEVSFDQSMVRKRVRWLGSESIKKYLKKLVSLEYLAVKSGFGRGQRVKYQLVADESLAAIAGVEDGKSG